MAQITVGISDMAIAESPDDLIVTYSLGSCLGVTFYDTVARIGGMIHCMLPLSSVDANKAAECPCMFIDTGVPRLLNAMFVKGCRKNQIVTKIAGASSVLDNKGLFRIGERNYAIFRKILWKNGMLITSEDIGGQISRTLRLEIGTGRVTVKSNGQEVEL